MIAEGDVIPCGVFEREEVRNVVDGVFVPWKDRDRSERRERITVDVSGGLKMEDCPAVITQEDREFWEKVVKGVKWIHDRGGVVDIPSMSGFM